MPAACPRRGPLTAPGGYPRTTKSPGQCPARVKVSFFPSSRRGFDSRRPLHHQPGPHAICEGQGFPATSMPLVPVPLVGRYQRASRTVLRCSAARSVRVVTRGVHTRTTLELLLSRARSVGRKQDRRLEAEMSRTPQEILQHHAGVLIAGDIDEIVADYAHGAFFITPRACSEVRRASVRDSPNC